MLLFLCHVIHVVVRWLCWRCVYGALCLLVVLLWLSCRCYTNSSLISHFYVVGILDYGQDVESIHALAHAMYNTPIVVATCKAYIISHGGLVSVAHTMYCSLIDVVVWSIYHFSFVSCTYVITLYWVCIEESMLVCRCEIHVV